MSTLIHFLNGKFVTEDELLISPRDLGFVRAYAVNDYFFTVHNKPFKVEQHVDRLFRSTAMYGLKMPWTKKQIIEWVYQTFEKNDKTCEKRMKVIVSGGISNSMYQAETPTIVMIVDDYVAKPSQEIEKGIKAKTVKYKRPYAEAKHTYHVETIRQLSLVKDQGITEIIYYDDSQVFEAGNSNLFALIDNKLVTTKSHVVEGLIRNTILEIPNLPVPVEVRDFTIDELMNAKEVFITNSRNGSIGIIEIDGKKVGDGTVGEVTKEVSRQYKEYVEQLNR